MIVSTPAVLTFVSTDEGSIVTSATVNKPQERKRTPWIPLKEEQEVLSRQALLFYLQVLPLFNEWKFMTGSSICTDGSEKSPHRAWRARIKTGPSAAGSVLKVKAFQQKALSGTVELSHSFALENTLSRFYPRVAAINTFHLSAFATC